MKQSSLIIGSLCAVGCEILYGMSYLLTKQATDHASGFALLGWRFSLAFLIMSLLIAVGVLKINLKGKSLKPLLLVALFSPVIYFCICNRRCHGSAHRREYPFLNHAALHRQHIPCRYLISRNRLLCFGFFLIQYGDCKNWRQSHILIYRRGDGGFHGRRCIAVKRRIDSFSDDRCSSDSDRRLYRQCKNVNEKKQLN